MFVIFEYKMKINPIYFCFFAGFSVSLRMASVKSASAHC